MKTEVIRTAREFAQLRERWAALNDAMDDADIFDTWEWHEASLTAMLGPNPALFTVVVYDEDRCVAIAPLAIVRRRIGVVKARVLQPINAGSAAYHTFCLDRRLNHHALLKAIVAELDSRSEEWDYLALSNLNSKSGAMTLARHLLDETFSTFAEESDVTTHLSCDGDFGAKFAVKELRNIERRERKLLRERDARIALDEPYSAALWTRLLELHRQKWTKSAVTGGSYGDFLERLLPALDARGQVGFSYIEVDGRIEAINLCLRMGGKVYGEIMNYAPTYAKWGIGQMLLKNVLHHYRESGACRIDFKQGAQPYKFYWTDQAGRNYNVYACANNGKQLYLSLYTWLKMSARSFVRIFGREKGRKRHAANGDPVGQLQAQTLGS